MPQPSMHYSDLREFIARLEAIGELKRITVEVDPYLEVTEICDRTLRAGGPALLFENPKGSSVPLLGNLFGTTQRVAYGMGEESVDALREVGKLLAFLKEPDPPKGFKDAWNSLPVFKKVLDMAPKTTRNAACQAERWDEIDLSRLPIQTCWPGDAGPLITWGLVITQGPHKKRQNMGIYRQQVIGPNKVIMRWLSHRGGALDFQEWQQAHPGQPFPLAVVLGADPATILAAVTPVPDSLSEHAFAGLLRGQRTVLAKAELSNLQIPASAEIVLEGYLYPDEVAEEGRATTRRASCTWCGVERSVCTHPATAVSRNRRFLSAARGLLLSHGNRQYEQTIPGSRQTSDVRYLVVSTPVHVHQVCRRRRCRY